MHYLNFCIISRKAYSSSIYWLICCLKTFNTVQYLHSEFNFFYIVLHSVLNQHTPKHSFHFFQDTARLLITWWRANIEQKSQRANHDWTNRALVHYLPPHYPCGALSGIVVILAKHISSLSWHCGPLVQSSIASIRLDDDVCSKTRPTTSAKNNLRVGLYQLVYKAFCMYQY